MTTATADSYAAMEKQLDDLRTQMADLLGKGESVDAVSIEYATLVKKVQSERKAANAAKINEAQSKFQQGVTALVDASGLAGLLGEEVTTVLWRVEKVSGKEPVFSISINPKRIPRSGNGSRPSLQIKVDGAVVKTHDFVSEQLPGVELGRGRVSKDNMEKAVAAAKAKGVKAELG